MKTLCLLAAVLLTAGCASSYIEDGRFTRGGFSETWLSPDVVEVRFKGNGNTSSERSSDFAMLRAAELCIGAKKLGILVEDRQSAMSTSGVVVETIVIPIEEPLNVVVARCVSDTEGALNAHFLQTSIRSKYGMESAQIVPDEGA